MKKQIIAVAFFSFIGLLSCDQDDPKNDDIKVPTVTKKEVILNYANIAYANYKKAYDDAVVLETAINTFVETPTAANFQTAKDKWLLSRESYGTTEGFRFADGPIDDANGPEGLINAWPLDENYIDYVDGAQGSGIINDATNPDITKDFLSGANENGGEKNISTGYHAIEFLLWGQDLTAPSENKAGLRPFTDYVSGGTAANQERRGLYLKVCADLLTDNLDYLVNQWKEGGVYRTKFLALDENVAIKNIYAGITTLGGAELPTERMEVALSNQDQEDEHSCFSDNTHRDIILNLQSIVNIYNGNYGTVRGASLKDLVAQTDGKAYNETLSSQNDAVAKVNAILKPFDLAISGGATSTEGAKVKEAATQLKVYTANLIAGAQKIGIIVND
jgi:putative iron-regulated protein